MMTRRRLALVGLGTLVVAIVAIVVGGVTGRIPLRPMLTFVQFKMNPGKARVQHLVQLKHPQTGQVVFLIGTTHQNHYTDPAYSIWHVKSAVAGLDVDTVMVEMMPDAIAEGRFGDGPVEMPFIALQAKQQGLAVVGMDAGWDKGWRGRQDKMFDNVQQALPTVKRGLIASGFMHVGQFEEQLHGKGFVTVPWSEAERQQVLDRDVTEVWPAGLGTALREAIVRAQQGKMATDPTRAADVDWFISVRQDILRIMGEPTA